MMRSLLRIHAHAWFTCGFCALAFCSLFYLKALEIFSELQVDEPSLTGSQRWSKAVHDVASRRLDNPSLWALAVVFVAGWMLTRAAAHCAAEKPLPPFIWTRGLKYWLWFLAMFILSTGSYLAVAHWRHGIFWYLEEAQNLRYADTPIPHIQQIEGILNLTIIFFSCSLVPVIRRLMELVRADGDSTEELSKARARLATMALGPFSMIASVSLIFKAIQEIGHQFPRFQFPLVHSKFDILTGIGGAFVVCSPLLIATGSLWLHPKRNGIKLKYFTGLTLLIWLVICLISRDMISPPRGLLEDDRLPGWMQAGVGLIKFFGILSSAGTGVFIWFVP